jgi:hypothetical protein
MLQSCSYFVRTTNVYNRLENKDSWQRTERIRFNLQESSYTLN